MALASHGSGKNNLGIFPGFKRLMAMTGQSRDRLWKSLVALKACNVIQWISEPGKSNSYNVMPTGLWMHKDNAVPVVRHADGSGDVDNSESGVDNFDFNAVPVVRHTDGGSPPHGRGVVRVADSNHTHLTRAIEPYENGQENLSFGELMQKIKDRARDQEDKKAQGP